MIRSYLTIGLRSLLKQKVYSVINILGLSTGIASCILIVMFVADELSYDSFHRNADRIYKVTLERKYPTYTTNYAVIPYSFGDVIQRDFPEVEAVVKMGGPFNNDGVAYRDRHGNEKVFEENFVMAADSNFFNVFGLAVMKGDAQTALAHPGNIVLTEETARRYFGDEDPLGKQLRLFDRDFSVTAVCEDVPRNSHMKFDFLFNYDEQFLHQGRPNFLGFSTRLYLLLKPGTNPIALEEKFPAMVETYAAAQFGNTWEEYRKAGNDYRYFLQPLRSIHLDPTQIEGQIKPGGNRTYSYFLGYIAGLILLIACINFMNLATSRSAERAREVGVRKTMGSARAQLVQQFLVESVLIAAFAMILSLCIVYSVLPAFNNLTGKELSLGFDPMMLIGLLVVTLVVGIIAGSYPAFVLSSFNPAQVMKGYFGRNAGGAKLRNGLVVFQFMISIILIVGTLVITRQMKYMQSKELGYQRDHVVVVERMGAMEANIARTFIDELKRLPFVEHAAGSFTVPGGNRLGDVFGEQWLSEGSAETLTTKSIVIDDDFADVIGLQLAGGRNFSHDSHDSLSVILNETAVRTFNLKDPIGQKLIQPGDPAVSFTIIGVFRDFNFESLHSSITPLTIRSTESFNGGAAYAFARIKGSDPSAAVGKIESLWKSMVPGQPFKYFFFDEDLYAQYEKERRAGQIFAVFSGLAIVIACVGLFGLAAYTTAQRTKEIGVRKVLGASLAGLVVLLSIDFAKLIGIAFLIAVPLSWYLMERWLESFAYRIELGVGVFLLSGMVALLIGWITVSYQSIKAAIVNPIRSLRSE